MRPPVASGRRHVLSRPLPDKGNGRGTKRGPNPNDGARVEISGERLLNTATGAARLRGMRATLILFIGLAQAFGSFGAQLADQPLLFSGMCDASAAVALSTGCLRRGERRRQFPGSKPDAVWFVWSQTREADHRI